MHSYKLKFQELISKVVCLMTSRKKLPRDLNYSDEEKKNLSFQILNPGIVIKLVLVPHVQEGLIFRQKTFS